MKKVDALASRVDPATREWVNARIEEESALIEARLVRILKMIKKNSGRVHGWGGNVHARMNKLEDAINLTPTTKRKLDHIIARIKELDE